jgi:hypothetical protein
MRKRRWVTLTRGPELLLIRIRMIGGRRVRVNRGQEGAPWTCQ